MTDTTAKQHGSIWYPSAEIVAKANVARLAAELRCEDCAQLYTLSIEQPETYRAHMMDSCISDGRGRTTPTVTCGEALP